MRRVCDCNTWDVIKLNVMGGRTTNVVILDNTYGKIAHSDGRLGVIDPNKEVEIVGRMRYFDVNG